MDTEPRLVQPNHMEDEVSLKELVLKIQRLVRYLTGKIYWIAGVGLLGGLLGLLSVSFDEPIYTAELTFVLEGASGGSQMAGYAGLASQFGLDMGGGAGQGVFEGENFLALMKSRLMIEKALLTTIETGGQKKTLVEFFIQMSGLRDFWIKKESPLATLKILPGADPATFSREQNTIISTVYQKILDAHLVVDKKDKKSGIIFLKVDAPDELFAKHFTEVLAREVSTFYIETKTKKSVDNVLILQHQTDSINRVLGSSMVGAAASLDANPNPNRARLVLRVPSERRQGQVQVNVAILTQLVQNLEISKMALRRETPLIQVIDRPVLPLKKTSPNMVMSFIKWMGVSLFIVIIFLILKRFTSQLVNS